MLTVSQPSHSPCRTRPQSFAERVARCFCLTLFLVVATRSAFVPTAATNSAQDSTATDAMRQDKNGPEQSQSQLVGWTEHDRLEHDLSVTLRHDERLHLLEDLDPCQAADAAMQTLMKGSSMKNRLESLFQKATSQTCRKTILRHFGYFVASMGREEALPFSGRSPSFQLNNSCPEPVYDDWTKLPKGVHLGHLQNRSYQPPRDQATYVHHPDELKLLYLILAHEDAPSVIRLVEALQDNNNSKTDLWNMSSSSPSPSSCFVIHVDAKDVSEATFLVLQTYALHHSNVHVLPHPYRVRVNWGGFSMVNATLQMLRYATGYTPGTRALVFDKAIHLSATTYPLASNTEIRHELAKYPLDANLMNVIMKPR